MTAQLIATLVGIVVQVLGAAYLVFQSARTSRKLAKYKSNITYDNFAFAIDDFAHELHGQFSQQLRGFAAIVVGSSLQFYGAFPSG